MQKKNKILVLSEVFYPEIGSGSNRITNLVIFLKAQGNKVDVITSEPSYPDKSLYESDEYNNTIKEEKLYSGSKTIRVKGSKLKPTANFFKRMYIYNYFLLKCIYTVLFNKSKYDVVITTMPSIFMGLLGIIAKWRFGAKYIVDIRDLWPECIKNVGIFRRNKFALKIGYRLEKLILRFTDASVVNSEAYKEYLEKINYEKPIRFIPNGLVKEEFVELQNLYEETEKNKDFTVIYTGLIGIAQNVKTIVKVANHLRNAKNIKFKIIGKGIQTPKVKDLIEHYKLTNIQVIPPMPKEKIINEIAKCHVAIAHLRKDSAFDLAIPGKLIDYMAIGIPIVAGIEGYTASVLIKSRAGIAVEPDDCKGLANAILHMYSDPYLRESYSKNGQNYSREKFLFDKNFFDYKVLIDELLGRGSKSKKVCMFVWNHFTNDARVLRECTALAESGYEVNLIALHDPNEKNLRIIEKTDGFNIRRVKRYPIYLIMMSSLIKKIKQNKLLIAPLLVLSLALIYFNPILAVIIVGIISLLLIKKVRTILIRGHIILRMIYFGVKDNADIYHSNDLNTMPQGYLCSKVLRRKRKLIYDSHEVQSSRTGYGDFERKMEKFFINKADTMIMTTHTRADYVRDLYKIDKPRVIHNYPFYSGDDSLNNKYDLHKLLDIPQDQKILLYQGGVQQGRGLEQLVDAIKDMESGVVVFLGDGKLKPTIKKMIQEKGLKDRVRFMDKVPVDELKYYTADAYLGFQVLNNVCFNHYSALSNKLFEYIMSQVPVIACDFPEIKRVVEGEQVGICVDSHKPKEIAKAVNKLLKDEKLHDDFTKNCLNAREKYNWNNEKNNFVSIYNNLNSNNIEIEVEQSIGV